MGVNDFMCFDCGKRVSFNDKFVHKHLVLHMGLSNLAYSFCRRCIFTRSNPTCSYCGEFEFRPINTCLNAAHREHAQKRVNAGGYRVIKFECPYRGIGWYLEHRIVMEMILKRKMKEGENVHHKNGDRLDNSPENLELWIVKQPPGQRASDLLGVK